MHDFDWETLQFASRWCLMPEAKLSSVVGNRTAL